MLNIINIRGTNGSGKSTVVRRIMEKYEHKLPQKLDGRRQPIGYICHNGAEPFKDIMALSSPVDTQNPLWVPGHYEIPCGGCDTIPTVKEAFGHVQWGLDLGCDVLFEGIMAQDNQQHILDWQASGKYKILVLGLTTDIQVCVAGINARREAKGNPKPLDPKNTISRARSVLNGMARLQKAGVKVVQVDRDNAVGICLQELGFGPQPVVP